jgi:hypothetical protein
MKRTPLRRKKRLNPINRLRRARELERCYGVKEYRVWGAMQSCCNCARPATTFAPNHNAHIRPRGELPTGMGRKADKKWLVTLCPSCHREYHDWGEAKFQRIYRIDLDLEAAARWARWRERDGTE